MSETIRLGLLGNNLGRSRAKHLNELLGELFGLKVTYQPMDMAMRGAPVAIAAELARCRGEGYRGVNVTHPFKCDAFAHVTTLPGFPEGLSAVNTVLFTADGMMGDNTDYSGCCRAFRRQFGSGFAPGRVLMLGAGGVAVAISYALKQLGVDELVIHDIKPEASKALVSQLVAGGLPARLANEDLVAEMRQADGLINATPVGMFQYPGNPFPANGFASQRWAFDAVYTPENTEFLAECRRRGIETLSGFYLFLYQGLDGFKRFTDITAPAEMVERVFLERFPLE